MTLTELRYIIAVAEEKHFGNAANRCYVSQPTLSIAIKKLEEELGLMMFDRSCNELKLTNGGEKIVEQAKKVLEEVELIKNIAFQEQDELKGVFKLGLIFTIAPYLLPKLIISLRSMAPEMPLMLEENYTHVLSQSLKKGDLDAAILAEPYEESGITNIPLYDEPFFVIVPKGHHFENKDYISRKELQQEKVMLLTEGNCMRDQVVENCLELAKKQNIEGLTNTLQGSSINTIRHMVASGLGISVMPATALTENDHLLFSIIPFLRPAPKRRVILAVRNQYIRPQAVETLRRAVLESKLAGVSFIQPDEDPEPLNKTKDAKSAKTKSAKGRDDDDDDIDDDKPKKSTRAKKAK